MLEFPLTLGKINDQKIKIFVVKWQILEFAHCTVDFEWSYGKN